MHKYLNAIEQVSPLYHMRLSRDKCKLLAPIVQGTVKFANREKVTRVEQADYLGSVLDMGRQADVEVNRITGIALDSYWTLKRCIQNTSFPL